METHLGYYDRIVMHRYGLFTVCAPLGRALKHLIYGGILLVTPAVAFEGPAYRIDGYSIPILDLSADRSRFVTVDREKDQYLGHPTTVLLPDGQTIFAVYPKGHAAGGLVLKRSDDGGLTWSDRLPVPDNWKTSKNPPSIHRLVGPDGRARLIVLTGSEENRNEDLPVRLSVSEDDGKTWTSLAPIGEGNDYNAIVVASSMLRLRDGRYMALHHSDYLRGPDGRRNMKLSKMLSSDGGLTWSQRQFVADHPVAEFCEPGAVRSPDGNEIAVLIRDNSRFRRGASESFLITSRDDGETWTPPRLLPSPLRGDRHVAKYAPDGRLVVVRRDVDFSSPTRGHFVAWVGTYDDVVTGRPGQYQVKLLHSYAAMDCGYAGLELLPDGTFVAVTYLHDKPYVRTKQGTDENVVMSVRFRLEDFDKALGIAR